MSKFGAEIDINLVLIFKSLLSQFNNPNSRSPLAMYTKREKTPQGRNQLIYLIRFFSFKFNMMASLSIMN